MSQKTKNSPESQDSTSENQIVQEAIDQRLLVDFHLTKDEVIVIRKAYLERRKELFRATRQELQDFINKDYRAANEEALWGKEGVKTLQKALNNDSVQYHKGLIDIDGRFGPSTFRTLIDFQKRAGLSPDGVAGPLTVKFLGITAELPNYVKPPTVQKPPVVEPVLPPKPDIAKIIKRYETRADGIRSSIDSLRSARDENTGLANILMDGAVWMFNGETGKMSYERQMVAIRERTRAALAELKTAVGTNEMSEKEKIRLARLNASYSALIKENLGGPEVLASAIASVKAVPETLTSVGYGAVWMVKWGAEVVTSLFDITAFIYKSIASEEYRKTVGIQWDALVQAKENAGGVTNLVANAFQAEVARVMSLPAEQQAEAIGKISGNVMGMIGVAGAGAKAAKAGGELLAKSAAARASSNAAKAAARTAKESAMAAEEAARLASQFWNFHQAASLSEKAAVHSAEAARHVVQAETLAAKASIANVQGIAMKTAEVALNGPIEALAGKMTNAVFFRTQLLLQSKKATPKSLQKSISKALLDNAEQKNIAKELGDSHRIMELEAQEKILIDAQKNLDGIPTLTDSVEPVLQWGNQRIVAERWIEPSTDYVATRPAGLEAHTVPPKSEPEIPKKVVDAPKTEPKKTPKPEKPTEPPRKKPTETPEPPKKAPEPPFKEFAFDSSATLTRNEQIFRSIYSTDRTIARNVSPEEIKRVGDLMAAYNRFSGPLKTARKTKDIKAIASAEAEMLTFLKDPAEWVKRVWSGNMKEANGKIYQNASSQEFKFSESEQFLVNMFESSYKDLDAVFSPLLHPVGSQKYMEQLMFRNVLGSLKKSLHTGKIAPSDALTNIHTFKDKPFEFVESTIAMPIMRSAFESSYKELSQIFSPSLYRAASREHIEQLLLSDVLGSLKKKVQSGGLTRTEALKNISMFQDNPRGFIELTLGKPFDEALYATKAWKNMAKAKK